MKKILNNLRVWLIYKLGGFTSNDLHRSYLNGKFVAHKTDKENADALYGLTSEEWCKRMYELLESNMDYSRRSIENDCDEVEQ